MTAGLFHDHFRWTFIASGAIRVKRLVGLNGAEATVQGQRVAGPALSNAADKEAFPAGISGVYPVISGGAINVGDPLTTDNQGRAIVATPLAIAAGSTDVTSTAANGSAILTGGALPVYVFGDALSATTGAGQEVSVLMRR